MNKRWQQLSGWQRHGVFLVLALLIAVAAWALLTEPEPAAAPNHDGAAAVTAAAALPPTAPAATAPPVPTTEPTTTPTPSPTAVLMPTPTAAATRAAARLPESWAGLQTTADVTAVILADIVANQPALLDDLTPAMWRLLPPEALAVVAADTAVVPSADLAAELTAIVQAATGQPPAPLPVPASWTAQASYAGLTVETTADLTPAALNTILGGTPELVDLLTPPLLLALPPRVVAALPAAYVASLDEGLQQTLALVVAYGGG